MDHTLGCSADLTRSTDTPTPCAFYRTDPHRAYSSTCSTYCSRWVDSPGSCCRVRPCANAVASSLRELAERALARANPQPQSARPRSARPAMRQVQPPVPRTPPMRSMEGGTAAPCVHMARHHHGAPKPRREQRGRGPWQHHARGGAQRPPGGAVPGRGAACPPPRR